MPAIKPAFRGRIVKKYTKKFIRRGAFNESMPSLSRKLKWNKTELGIDSPTLRRFKSQGRPMPNKGYGSDRRTKYIHPDGFKHFPVTSPQDLQMLLMQNRKYAAVIAHTVGAKARKAIVRRAHELNVRLVNGGAKLRKLEKANKL